MTSVYISTYTEPGSGDGQGIYLFDFDEAAGRLEHRATFFGGKNLSFLALNAKGDRLYAVNELDEGTVSALERDPATGALTFMNTQRAHGASPCFISFAPGGHHVLAANYIGGTLAVLPIANDGSLLPASDVVDHRTGRVKPRRDTLPHPHMIAATPDGSAVLVTDLGLDATLTYRFDSNAGTLSLAENGIAPANVGAGPRHFAFSPDGTTVYVINELNSTLDVFGAASGVLDHRQTMTSLPENYKGENSCAQVLVSPGGRFVYGSNRGHDSIAIWAVDRDTSDVGKPSFVPTGGKNPRNFAISPSGDWFIAANQSSGNALVFRRDSESGGLTHTGQTIEIPAPVCVLFCD